MARVIDVAAYILDRMSDVTAMKLQKLTYYCQAWSLAWDECELFPEQFEAWAGGPVCPLLYERHRGQFKVTRAIVADGDPSALTAEQCDTIDRVLTFYGRHPAQWLSDLTHLEAPWLKARERAGVGPGDFCREDVTIADMAEYYSGLEANAPTPAIT